MKICVIGGGSTYTPELIEGFLKIEKILDIKEIILLDIKESSRKIAILTDFSKRILKRAKSNIKLDYTYDPVKAMEGTNAVISQFRAGVSSRKSKR